MDQQTGRKEPVRWLRGEGSTTRAPMAPQRHGACNKTGLVAGVPECVGCVAARFRDERQGLSRQGLSRPQPSWPGEITLLIPDYYHTTVQSTCVSSSSMPFALGPASEVDLEAVAVLQFAACADDPAFSSIFPSGASSEGISNFAAGYGHALAHDPGYAIMKTTDAESGARPALRYGNSSRTDRTRRSRLCLTIFIFHLMPSKSWEPE